MANAYSLRIRPGCEKDIRICAADR
jgi:hypothetical protein